MESAGTWNGAAYQVFTYGNDSRHWSMGSALFLSLSSLPSPTPAIPSRTKKADDQQPGSVGNLVEWNWFEQTRPDLWPLSLEYIKRAGGSETSSFWRCASLWSPPVLWKKVVRESALWLWRKWLWKIGLVYISHLEPSGGPVMYRGTPYQPEQVRNKVRVSEDSSSPHSGVWQRCVSIPWAQQELWKLANTEAVLQPRSMWPDERSVHRRLETGFWVNGRKHIPVGTSTPRAVQKVTSNAPQLRALNEQGHKWREPANEWPQTRYRTFHHRYATRCPEPSSFPLWGCSCQEWSDRKRRDEQKLGESIELDGNW